MAKYYGREESGSGLLSLLGILFIVIGVYALVSIYGIFSLKLPFTSEQILIATSIGSIIGGIFMLVRREKHGYF